MRTRVDINKKTKTVTFEIIENVNVEFTFNSNDKLNDYVYRNLYLKGCDVYVNDCYIRYGW